MHEVNEGTLLVSLLQDTDKSWCKLFYFIVKVNGIPAGILWFSYTVETRFIQDLLFVVEHFVVTIFFVLLLQKFMCKKENLSHKILTNK